MSEDLKAKARELIENAPKGLLKRFKNNGCRGFLCSNCYFSINKLGNSDCSAHIEPNESACEMATAELARRQTPEYRAQQALRAIPDEWIIAAMTSTNNCSKLNGKPGTDMSQNCRDCVIGPNYSSECKPRIKAEYARRFPHGHEKKELQSANIVGLRTGHGEKGAAMKIDVGKKYRVVKDCDGFSVGDIVVTEHDNYPSDVYFFKRISDGCWRWINKNNLAPYADDEYPLTLSQAIEATMDGKYTVVIGNGTNTEYRFCNGEFQAWNIMGWQKTNHNNDYLNSCKYRIVREPVTTTELVGMFGSHKVEVTRKDGKLVRDMGFEKNHRAARNVIARDRTDTYTPAILIGDYKMQTTLKPTSITIGCQTVPFADALELAHKFIKIAEGK